MVIIQKYVRKWLERRAYLKFLSVTTSIQCCWRKVLATKEFWRFKQKATKVAINHIQDSRVNVLEEGGNDMVQLCDTTQVRSDSDFGIKSVTTLIFLHSFSQYIGKFQVIFFLYIQVPPKFSPKFRQSLPYTGRSQVIDIYHVYTSNNSHLITQNHDPIILGLNPTHSH